MEKAPGIVNNGTMFTARVWSRTANRCGRNRGDKLLRLFPETPQLEGLCHCARASSRCVFKSANYARLEYPTIVHRMSAPRGKRLLLPCCSSQPRPVCGANTCTYTQHPRGEWGGGSAHSAFIAGRRLSYHTFATARRALLTREILHVPCTRLESDDNGAAVVQDILEVVYNTAEASRIRLPLRENVRVSRYVEEDEHTFLLKGAHGKHRSWMPAQDIDGSNMRHQLPVRGHHRKRSETREGNLVSRQRKHQPALQPNTTSRGLHAVRGSGQTRGDLRNSQHGA